MTNTLPHQAAVRRAPAAQTSARDGLPRHVLLAKITTEFRLIGYVSFPHKPARQQSSQLTTRRADGRDRLPSEIVKLYYR